MEPKDSCKKAEKIDCVLIPTVGVSKSGVRLGYGKGYYDRFLSLIDAVKISLTYSKQVVKSIPNESHDVKIDWIVTEDENVKISQVELAQIDLTSLTIALIPYDFNYFLKIFFT